MSTELELLLAELQDEFLDELPSRCNDLESAILALEDKQAGAFDELFRQVHSLKGVGGGVGLAVITTICHQFETFLGEAKQDFRRKAATVSMAYVDLMRRIITPEGRSPKSLAAIDLALEEMWVASLSGRASILMAEPSNSVCLLYQREFSSPTRQVRIVKSGMDTLARLLHEPYDVLVVSRELPDLNAIAVISALRESHCRNANIPVILVSSNAAPIPAHLSVHAIVRRDVNFIAHLSNHINGSLQQRLAAAKKH